MRAHVDTPCWPWTWWQRRQSLLSRWSLCPPWLAWWQAPGPDTKAPTQQLSLRTFSSQQLPTFVYTYKTNSRYMYIYSYTHSLIHPVLICIHGLSLTDMYVRMYTTQACIQQLYSFKILIMGKRYMDIHYPSGPTIHRLCPPKRLFVADMLPIWLLGYSHYPINYLHALNHLSVIGRTLGEHLAQVPCDAHARRQMYNTW